jgi:hypothetical protein
MAATAGMDAWSRLLAEATEGAEVLVKPGYEGMLALISEKKLIRKRWKPPSDKEAGE